LVLSLALNLQGEVIASLRYSQFSKLLGSFAVQSA